MSEAAQIETKGEQNVLRVPYPALRATLPKGKGFWERKRFKDAYKPSPLGKVRLAGACGSGAEPVLSRFMHKIVFRLGKKRDVYG